jgi:hypothetical protein
MNVSWIICYPFLVVRFSLFEIQHSKPNIQNPESHAKGISLAINDYFPLTQTVIAIEEKQSQASNFRISTFN